MKPSRLVSRSERRQVFTSQEDISNVLQLRFGSVVGRSAVEMMTSLGRRVGYSQLGLLLVAHILKVSCQSRRGGWGSGRRAGEGVKRAAVGMVGV